MSGFSIFAILLLAVLASTVVAVFGAAPWVLTRGLIGSLGLGIALLGTTIVWAYLPMSAGTQEAVRIEAAAAWPSQQAHVDRIIGTDRFGNPQLLVTLADKQQTTIQLYSGQTLPTTATVYLVNGTWTPTQPKIPHHTAAQDRAFGVLVAAGMGVGTALFILASLGQARRKKEGGRRAVSFVH